MTRLFELRKERGLSQRDMAVEFSVSQSTYNNWENARTQPSIEQLIALADDGTLDEIRSAWFANDVTIVSEYADEYRK